MLLAGSAAAEPQVIIDTDFGVPGKAFEEINATKGIRITGSLPEGWSDNTNWKNNVVADYKLDQVRAGDSSCESSRPPGMACSSCTGCREWRRKMGITA